VSLRSAQYTKIAISDDVACRVGAELWFLVELVYDETGVHNEVNRAYKDPWEDDDGSNLIQEAIKAEARLKLGA
jgi:hypothetical protein